MIDSEKISFYYFYGKSYLMRRYLFMEPKGLTLFNCIFHVHSCLGLLWWTKRMQWNQLENWNLQSSLGFTTYNPSSLFTPLWVIFLPTSSPYFLHSINLQVFTEDLQ